MDKVTVIQADRASAVEMLRAMWRGEHGNVAYGWMRDEESATLAGKRDDLWAVQAFAKHREVSATPAPDSEKLREAAFRERWYYALNEDAEHWYGAKDNRDEAIEAGRADHNGEAFYICAGTPMRHQLDPFTEDVDGVINAFQNANEEMFGEDGQGDPENDWTDDQCRDLARRLNATFAEWARDHGHDKAYMLDLSKGEIVPALGASS